MEQHIETLGKTKATVDGKQANMVLDLRVPSGGYDQAKFLIKVGEKNGVTVLIKEVP